MTPEERIAILSQDLELIALRCNALMQALQATVAVLIEGSDVRDDSWGNAVRQAERVMALEIHPAAKLAEARRDVVDEAAGMPCVTWEGEDAPAKYRGPSRWYTDRPNPEDCKTCGSCLARVAKAMEIEPNS